jgi:hypothetical protein
LILQEFNGFGQFLPMTMATTVETLIGCPSVALSICAGTRTAFPRASSSAIVPQKDDRHR